MGRQISRGMGAFASRVSVMTGSAAHLAAQQLRQRLLDLQSCATGIPADQLIIVDGFVKEGNKRDIGVSLPEIVQNVVLEDSEIHNGKKCLRVESSFESTHMTYPYGIHLAVVRVDQDCGSLEIERMVVAYDVGKAINPLLIEGQIVGGVAQGFGGSLLEEFVYDENVQPLATSFMDYLLPTITEVPAIEVLLREDAPSGTNSLGIKGAGEGGITAVGAVLAAAIDNALDANGAIRRLPISAARIHEILKSNVN